MPRKEDVLLGRYRLIRQLGEGGHAAVWLAKDQRRDSLVAVKQLHVHQNRPISKERFEREGDVLRALHHPSIAGALGFHSDEGRQLLILEYVPGRTLAELHIDRARSGSPFSLVEVLNIVAQIALALDYAHSLGIIHRDLKPQNVMICAPEEELRIKILDFGIARLMEESADRRTTVGRIVGSKFFMAPEQTSGKADPRTDVFALATLTFELLTDRRAWSVDNKGEPAAIGEPLSSDDNTPVEVIRRILSRPRPIASRYRGGIGGSLDRLLMQSMAVRPEERPASAGAFVKKLQESLLSAPLEDGPAEHTASIEELGAGEPELSRVVPSEWTSAALTDSVTFGDSEATAPAQNDAATNLKTWGDNTSTLGSQTATATALNPGLKAAGAERGRQLGFVAAAGLLAVIGVAVAWATRDVPATLQPPAARAEAPKPPPKPAATPAPAEDDPEPAEALEEEPKETETAVDERAEKKASPKITRRKKRRRAPATASRRRAPAPSETEAKQEPPAAPAKKVVDQHAAQAKVSEVYDTLKARAESLPLDQVEAFDKRLLELRKQLGGADQKTIERVHAEAVRLHARIKKLASGGQ